MYSSIAGLLFEAKVPYVPWPTDTNILLTDANQLIGRYSSFERFRKKNSGYFGWHAHHVVEDNDIQRLGLKAAFPKYEDQLCVLLPPTAHASRINSVLPRVSSRDSRILLKEIRDDYRITYAMIGDYCGSSEAKIQEELMRIVDTTLKLAGV
jgi:hypothetical protein